MSINKELSDFYRKQGLTGNHLRRALQHDKRAVRANMQPPIGHGRRTSRLISCFSWSRSPQGNRYWAARGL